MAAESESGDDEEYEALAYQQRLKAALHYTVGRVCEETGDKAGLTFSRQFIASLTETTYRQCESFAVDLELFAKHAKRSTVNQDDVKLLARKSPALFQHMTEISNEMTVAHDAERANKKAKKAKRKKTDEDKTNKAKRKKTAEDKTNKEDSENVDT